MGSSITITDRLKIPVWNSEYEKNHDSKLVNVVLNDLFFFVNEDNLCNFTDDNSLHRCAKTLEEVLEALDIDTKIISYWYEINSLVANPAKFQMLFPGSKNVNLALKIGSFELKSSDQVKLATWGNHR